MASSRARVAVWVIAAVAVGGCAPRETPGHEGTGGAPSATNAPPRARAPVEPGPRIVVLGDSLTAGLGLSADEAYPALLQQRLDTAGLKYHVVNAGVSGDTSAGGLSRLDWALEGDVQVLIVALGGNDALRGLPIDELRHNLSTIIQRAQARGIAVILAGMEAPPNFGRSYIVEFHEVYRELSKKYGVAFLPFLLEGVAGIESLNQRDGIHPTAQGARLVANNVWAVLRPLLEERAGRK
jgi:acyl-CoA thioesterase I